MKGTAKTFRYSYHFTSGDIQSTPLDGFQCHWQGADIEANLSLTFTTK